MKRIIRPLLLLALSLTILLNFSVPATEPHFWLDTETLYLDKGETGSISVKDPDGISPFYLSQDPDIATVSPTGMVTGTGTGICQIYVTQGEQTETVEVRVNYGRYLRRGLSPSEEREDYPNLSDEAYANFRPITTTGMGKGVLYRSSTPISPALNRNREADEACERAGIVTILNLANKKKKLPTYEGYEETYYSRQNILCSKLGTDFFTPDFQKGLKKCLRFLISQEGPYLIHCSYGRDRTGFVCAILECLLGASLDEVLTDYMVSYENYNGLTPDDPLYQDLSHYLMEHDLERAFETDQLEEADLSQEAREYLLSIGLTEEEIEELIHRLSGE